MYSRPKYSLSKKPITLSKEDVQSELGLDKNGKPKEYVDNDFKDNGDGTITDRATGLMWQQSGSDDYIPYEKAEEYIQGLNRKIFAGYGDWRLPIIPDLIFLLEKKTSNEGIYVDPVFDKKRLWCWSCNQRSADSAWLVNFGYSLVHWSDCDSHIYVRAVRVRQ